MSRTLVGFGNDRLIGSSDAGLRTGGLTFISEAAFLISASLDGPPSWSRIARSFCTFASSTWAYWCVGSNWTASSNSDSARCSSPTCLKRMPRWKCSSPAFRRARSSAIL